MSDPLQTPPVSQTHHRYRLIRRVVLLPFAARADDPSAAIYQKIVPARKELDAAWALSLAKRGAELDCGDPHRTKNPT